MLNAKKKNRSDRGSNDSTTSPEHKLLRVEESKMAASPTELELLSSTTKEDEPSLKEIYELLTDVQATVTKLLKTSFQLTNDVAKLKNSVERNRKEVSNLKDELVNQNKYMASL